VADVMTGTPIVHTPSAYGNPLLIKHIFRSAMNLGSDQKIVHAAHRRFTYRDSANAFIASPPPCRTSASGSVRPSP
jgi:hypothetical protein